MAEPGAARARRFVAPAHASLDPQVWQRAPLSLWRDEFPWLEADRHATAGELNRHWKNQSDWRFVPQTRELLADGLHYEQRIHDHGAIATRADNWHDLFNALVWLRYPRIKAALNARQVAEIACVGTKQRSRAQCALTHFDEAGAIVVLRDPALLAAWDAHDWHGLFWRDRDAWHDGRIAVSVFGHALLEHALSPHQLLVGKVVALCLPPSPEASHASRAGVHEGAGAAPAQAAAPASCVPARQVRASARAIPACGAAALARVAQAIAAGEILDDPQELRPLPLSGIPGWHADNAEEAFYRSAPCFRPLRPGRRYPAPLE